MTAQKGKDLLLKIHNGTTYETVAGLRSRRLAFNAAAVDITDAESAGRGSPGRGDRCAGRVEGPNLGCLPQRVHEFVVVLNLCEPWMPARLVAHRSAT